MTQTTILQISPGIGGGREEAADSDIAAINLNRLLARLKLNILSPSADLTLLRRSQYHRVRVGAVCSLSLLSYPLLVVIRPTAESLILFIIYLF
jgi:hypothetical protein